MAEKLAAGIDLGGTNMKAALVTESGRIVASMSRRTNAERGPQPVMEELAGMIGGLIEEVGIARDEVTGLGIGSPGPLSHREGIVYHAANLPGWQQVHLRRGMLERTGLPTVLDNDANAAAYGEFWAGAGRGTREMVTLTLGTGIGAGVIISGEVLRGYYENAGELGHTIVVAGGRQCTCGQHGCLEQYASAGNVAKHCMEKIRMGQPSSLAEALKRDGRFGARLIAEAAQAGDELARRAWDEACLYIAIGCVNIQHTFNPELILLAGGMSKAGEFLLQGVREQCARQRWQLHDDSPHIAVSALGDEAGVIGAAGLAWSAWARSS